MKTSLSDYLQTYKDCGYDILNSIFKGKTIKKCLIDDSYYIIVLITTQDEFYIFRTEGETTNDVFFADIIGLTSLKNSVITKIELLEGPHSNTIDNNKINKSYSTKQYKTKTSSEFDDIYGFTIYTLKGRCDFIYRNMSEDYPYWGDVKIEKWDAIQESKFKEINMNIDEWSA